MGRIGRGIEMRHRFSREFPQKMAGRCRWRRGGGGGVQDGADTARRGRLVNESTIKVRYGGINGTSADVIGGSNGDRPPPTAPLLPLLPSWIEVEVVAHTYMSKLRQEVRHLRNELEVMRLAREEEVRRDLLAYIRPLLKVELQRLMGTMSTKVLEAIKGLVLAVLSGIGKGVGVEEEEEEEGGGRGATMTATAVRTVPGAW